jgi:Na+-driven multidrug efflux pump
MSAFGMVDGIFAARVIDAASFAATGIVWPLVAFAMAFGLMLSIGGSAVVAKQLAQGETHAARANFTMLTLVTFGSSVLLGALGLLFPDALLGIIGADDFLRPLASEYMQPLLWMMPMAMVGFFIQQFFITEGKPNLGFVLTFIGGAVNLGLNFLLIAHWQWGLRGAALATMIGYSIPAVGGVVYFARNRDGALHFVRPQWNLRILGNVAVNGMSEMITMLAGSITGLVMNNILIDLRGYEGVAAVGVMMVGQMLLMSTFLGYATGIAPIISFNYGKGDTDRLRRLFRRSLAIIGVASVVSIVAGWFLAHPLTIIYVPTGTPIYDMAIVAFRFGLIGFLFMGVNGFASVMFTALNNGVVSGVLSFFRTLVFVLFMLSLLPAILDVNGVWLALPAAELLALSMSLVFFAAMRRRYGYA